MSLIEIIQSFPEPFWVLSGTVVGIGGAVVVAFIQKKAEQGRLELELKYREKERIAESEEALRKSHYLDALNAASTCMDIITQLPARHDNFEMPHGLMGANARLKMIASKDLIMAVDEFGVIFLQSFNSLIPILMQKANLFVSKNVEKASADSYIEKRNNAFQRHRDACHNNPQNRYLIESIDFEIKSYTEAYDESSAKFQALDKDFLKKQIEASRMALEAQRALLPQYNKILYIMRKEVFVTDKVTSDEFQTLLDVGMRNSEAAANDMFAVLEKELDNLMREDA